MIIPLNKINIEHTGMGQHLSLLLLLLLLLLSLSLSLYYIYSISDYIYISYFQDKHPFSSYDLGYHLGRLWTHGNAASQALCQQLLSFPRTLGRVDLGPGIDRSSGAMGCWMEEPLVNIQKAIPYAPCMVYLHTKLGDFVRANVGKHIPAPWVAYGYGKIHHLKSSVFLNELSSGTMASI